MATTKEIPNLFDDNGKLIAIDASTLDPAMAERYRAVVSANAENQQAEQTLADANNEVRDALAAVTNTETFYKAHWPPQTPFELWQENFGGGPREAMRARGLIK